MRAHFPSVAASDRAEILASRPGADAVQRLFRLQHARNVALLRSMVTQVRAAGGPVYSRLLEQLEILSDVVEEHPATSSVLTHPSVSDWLARAVHRLRAGRERGLHETGYLGNVAASACHRAGIERTVTVQATNGVVDLPSVGRFHHRRLDGPVRLTSSSTAASLALGSEVLVQAPDLRTAASGWQPARIAVVGSGVLRWQVEVDDGRGYGGPGTPRTSPSDAELSGWSAAVGAAWDGFAREHPADAMAVASGLGVLVPLEPVLDRPNGLSATSRFSPGALSMTPPRDAAGLAATLVHELRHTVLNLLLIDDDALADDQSVVLYSPWRNDPRPAFGVLHGLYAAAGLVRLWDRDAGRGDRWAEFQRTRGRGQVVQAVRSLRRSGLLLPPGEELVAAIEASLPAGAGAPAAEDAAALGLDDHRAQWRLRWLETPAGVTAEVVSRRLGGLSPPVVPGSVLRSAPAPGPRSLVRAGERLSLVRRALAGADRAPLEGREGALAAGRWAEALAGFRTEILDGNAGVAEWAGFCVAATRIGRDPGPELATRPEVLRDVHVALRSAGRVEDPLELARWLATTGGD